MNLLPGLDRWLDEPFQREMDEVEIEEEDEGDGFPEPCEVARSFVDGQREMVERLEANREMMKRERRAS